MKNKLEEEVSEVVGQLESKTPFSAGRPVKIKKI
jgi:hypothetical protein